jgi:hypothetical protein
MSPFIWFLDPATGRTLRGDYAFGEWDQGPGPYPWQAVTQDSAFLGRPGAIGFYVNAANPSIPLRYFPDLQTARNGRSDGHRYGCAVPFTITGPSSGSPESQPGSPGSLHISYAVDSGTALDRIIPETDSYDLDVRRALLLDQVLADQLAVDGTLYTLTAPPEHPHATWLTAIPLTAQTAAARAPTA